VRALWAIVVILSGLVAGGAFNNAVAMAPALRTFDEQTYADLRRSWSPLPTSYSMLASIVAALLGIALLGLYDLSSTADALVASAVALGVLLLVILAAARRVERQTAAGGDNVARRRWRAAQLAAGAVSLTVVACYATAAGPAS
jgi:glycerol uptake facilitator-like aquaporin